MAGSCRRWKQLVKTDGLAMIAIYRGSVDAAPEDARLRAWEQRTSAVLTFSGGLFLLAYAVRVLKPDLPSKGHLTVEIVELVTWAALLVDIAVRLGLSTNRRRFLRTHIFDLIVLALPAARPLRVLRLVSILTAVHRRVTAGTRLRLSVYVGGTTALLVFVASLAVLDAERHSAKANITTYGESLWWTICTVSTVGYGDHYPITVEGRAIAVGLMIGGIGLLGFVTGSLASWFTDQFSQLQANEVETRDDVAELLVEVRTLRAEIAELKRLQRPAEPLGGP
jgi:voltage-gated potassium channel